MSLWPQGLGSSSRTGARSESSMFPSSLPSSGWPAMFVDKEKGSRREGCHKQLPDRSLAELWAPELWQLKHRSRADPCLTLNCV